MKRMLVLTVLILLMTGCYRKPALLVTADVSRGMFHPTVSGISSSSTYEATIKVDSSGNKITYDYMVMAFLNDSGKGLTHVKMKYSKDESALKAVEKFNATTNGYTDDLLRDSAGSAIYLVVYLMKDHKPVSDVYSVELPSIADLPNQDMFGSRSGKSLTLKPTDKFGAVDMTDDVEKLDKENNL